VIKLLAKNTPSEFLNELLTRAHDAKQGVLVAAGEVENQALKDWFRTNPGQRRSFIHSIKGLLKDFNAKPDKDPGITEKVHKTFMKLRAALSGEEDNAMIAECHEARKPLSKNMMKPLSFSSSVQTQGRSLKTSPGMFEPGLEPSTPSKILPWGVSTSASKMPTSLSMNRVK
jgi:uncharacterized protein (TIGR02284 family)